MFKQSIWMVLAVVLVVFVSTSWTQWKALGELPSAYDPGVRIQEAFQTAETPLLVEFYSDDCGSCRQATPVLHGVYNSEFKDKLTLVMLDVNEPDAAQVGQLFGVESIPAVYVFNPKVMHKEMVPLTAFESEGALKAGLKQALTRVKVAKKQNKQLSQSQLPSKAQAQAQALG